MKVSTQLMIVLLLVSTSLSAASAEPPAKSRSKSSSSAKKPAPHPASTKGTAARAASSGASDSAAFNAYANQIRQKMSTNWHYPDGKNHVTLTIQVLQDGSVSNLTLASVPKNNEAEQKANDAFNSAQPLQALPAGVSEARITAIFDSQADQWDSRANISVKIDPVKSSSPTGDGRSNDTSGSDKIENKTEDKK